MSEYYDSKILVKRINSRKLFSLVVALPELPRLLIKFVVNDLRTPEAMRRSEFVISRRKKTSD